MTKYIVYNKFFPRRVKTFIEEEDAIEFIKNKKNYYYVKRIFRKRRNR